MNYSTHIRGNSYDLSNAVNILPADTKAVVLVERTCTAPKLNIVLEAFDTEREAQEFFSSLDIRGRKGWMKHIIPSVDRLHEYAKKVHEVRVNLELDPAEA